MGSATSAPTTTTTVWTNDPTSRVRPSVRNTSRTLPPPPQTTKAPATTSGDLSATSQPVPPGWVPTTAPGNVHAGQARDPHYAAWEAMMTGCAPVDRRRWIDPTHAFQLTMTKAERPGVGVMLQFGNRGAAELYQGELAAQLRACPGRPTGGSPGVTTIENSPGRWIGRRSYADGGVWAEVIVVKSNVVRLWILQDAGASTPAQLRALADQLSA